MIINRKGVRIITKSELKQTAKNEMKGCSFMKVYRLYVKGVCVETFGFGEAAKMQAFLSMGNWFALGYTSNDCEIRLEDF